MNEEKTADYDYHLPEELIAAEPAAVRDASRLMVISRNGITPPLHRVFHDLPEHLRAGDVLVLNDSRVLPARLLGQRDGGTGVCEALLLAPLRGDTKGGARWSALVRPGKKLTVGTKLHFPGDLHATIEEERDGGERVLRFDLAGADLRAALERHGTMPLPPYILARRGERAARPEDRERYQTVYAQTHGSVAAPTAGLHFTPELLDRIEALGVEIVRVTLHVGMGTFAPIATDRIADHKLHSEQYEVSASTAETINDAKAAGRRVIAVGTTSTRTLESAVDDDGRLRAGRAESSLMIAPGHRWRIVDGLVTNFHLPRSSLLCLVAAMIGRERLMALYAEAIHERYRFYSYGDAMFLEPNRQPE